MDLHFIFHLTDSERLHIANNGGFAFKSVMHVR